jgi:hypothetical protein
MKRLKRWWRIWLEKHAVPQCGHRRSLGWRFLSRCPWGCEPQRP